MSKREVADYLQDILDAVAAIEQFTTDIEFEAFSQNLEKVFAVVKGDRNHWRSREAHPKFSQKPIF